MNSNRYGDAFRFDRVINVSFYTSSTEKLLQARLVFARRGYKLQHFKGVNEPYDEDYTLGTERLLERAIKQITSEFGLRSVFFVEDTSLRLEALSANDDFPGMGVKEWFAATSFEELARQIALRGGDRTATIKSDIALHVPTLSRPILIHGEVAGKVAQSPPKFSAGIFPWLSPQNFNGWFIPDGATRRLGEMEFEESLLHDFRVRSLSKLIDRLEELNSAVNLGPRFYTARKPASSTDELLLPLPLSDIRVLIVVGYKCAGKTTFGDHLVERDETHVFEASAVLRDIAAEHGDQINSSEDATRFLKAHGENAVAARVVQFIERLGYGLFVVTGLRIVDEVLLLMRRFLDCRIIFVDADSRLRFERHLKRARDTDIKTFKEFIEQDDSQRNFGILQVGTELADLIVPNNSSLDEYGARVDRAVDSLWNAKPRDKKVRSHAPSELERCLRALAALGKASTCDEISTKTHEQGVPVRRYNTNRALKAVPKFVTRIEKRGHLLRYRLTQEGRTLLLLFDEIVGRRGHPELRISKRKATRKRGSTKRGAGKKRMR